MITLTDSERSPMTEYSDCNLIARSDMASIADSLVAPLSVINALVVALCMKKQKEMRRTLAFLEEIWDENQVYGNDGIEEETTLGIGENKMSKVLIVGGGAAGMFASIFAARNGNEVHVFEKNENSEKIIHYRERTL